MNLYAYKRCKLFLPCETSIRGPAGVCDQLVPMCTAWCRWVDPDDNEDNGVLSDDGRDQVSVLRLDALMLMVQVSGWVGEVSVLPRGERRGGDKGFYGSDPLLDFIKQVAVNHTSKLSI